MTRSDIAIFDKEKSTRSSPNASSFVTAVAMIKAIKSLLKWSYDKQNLTHVVISYEIYETSQIWYEVNSLYLFISEASKCHMCKFTELRQIVCKLFKLSMNILTVPHKHPLSE